MESRQMRPEVGEAAQHLRIELYNVQDDWRKGLIPEETLRNRVQTIRLCAANLRKPTREQILLPLILGD